MSRLPLELMEFLLLKAIRALFKIQNGGTNSGDRPDLAAVQCLASVCSDWRSAMHGYEGSTTSYWFRHKLRRLMVHCRPYRYRPRELTRLDPGQFGCWVCGLASTHNQLYVARFEAKGHLAVYSLSAEYTQLDNLHIDDLLSATDLAADNDVLYIAENSVFRIVADSEQRTAEEWIQLEGKATTLSVTPAGQLVVRSGDSVSVYNRAGIREFKVDLADTLLDPHHAALTASGSFVVSHGGLGSHQHGVCLVSRDGVIMASYGHKPGSGPGQVKWPRHIALDAEDRVLVCDSGNQRVLLLDSKLNFLRVLLDLSSVGVGCRPFRLWFDRRTAILSVGFDNGLIVIYKLN